LLIGLLIAQTPVRSTPATPEAADTSSAPARIGLVRVSYANVRKAPAADAERVTQVLLMDACRIRRSQGDWCEVEVIAQRHYLGWIRDDLLAFSPPADTSVLPETLIVRTTTSPVLRRADQSADIMVQAQMGTYLPVRRNAGDYVCVQLPAESGYVAREDCLSLDSVRAWPESTIRDGIVAAAVRLKGVRYLWGGITPAGVDCSGLVYLCYRLCGILLERDAGPQFRAGEQVDVADLRPGDAVYFTTYKAGPSHTGIFAEGRRFIQASSSKGVIETSLDQKYFARRFYSAARLLGEQR